MSNAPFVCTLDEQGARARLEQAHGLATRLRRRDLSDNRLALTFANDGETELLVDEFVRDEQQCCSFFEFTVAHADEAVTLEVAAPEGAEHMLEAAMASFDPTLSDEERLSLHRVHSDPTAEAGDDGGCGC